MNFKGAAIAIILNLALSTGVVQGKLNGIHTNNQEKNEGRLMEDSITNTRELQSHHTISGLCSFNGETREPGQWIEGPVKTCMCDRYGSSTWVDCVPNEASTHGGGPNPDTALGARQEFDAKDFVFDLLGSVPGSITDSGSVQALTVNQLPSLAGQGISYALVNLEPCGINLPHVHPRASELIYVIDGPKDHLRTAFVEENGGRVIVNDIGQGETMLFPEGLIHYQQNLSCEPVTFLAALSSEDPGVVTITTQFFQLPKEAVVASLNQPPSVVQKLIAGLPAGPAEGRQQCMQKCGLTYSW